MFHQQISPFYYSEGQDSLECLDWEGNLVEHGLRYIPDREKPCEHCECHNGQPVRCVSMMCAPPPCQNYVQVPGKCCQVRCLVFGLTPNPHGLGRRSSQIAQLHRSDPRIRSQRGTHASVPLKLLAPCKAMQHHIYPAGQYCNAIPVTWQCFLH